MIKMLEEIHEEIRKLALAEEAESQSINSCHGRDYGYHTGRIDAFANALVVIQNKIIDIQEAEFEGVSND